MTVIALSYGGLLEGSVLVETIFSWPGIGNYIYSSLFAADMNAVLGGTLLVGIVFVLLNMLTDVLYARARPALAELRQQMTVTPEPVDDPKARHPRRAPGRSSAASPAASSATRSASSGW